MTEAGIEIIDKDMNALGLNYEFMEGTPGVYPYFVGEYQEVPTPNEDGLEESAFILTGYARGIGAWLSLEEAKKQIKKLYPKSGGKQVIAEDGTAVAIFYSNSLVIPTEDAELKKIQINLDVKEWSVN